MFSFMITRKTDKQQKHQLVLEKEMEIIFSDNFHHIYTADGSGEQYTFIFVS